MTQVKLKYYIKKKAKLYGKTFYYYASCKVNKDDFMTTALILKGTNLTTENTESV
ncbi:hypothetical protein [Clostridium sp. DL-VIII]|uniref:hypothetical protein n=1 Tax=Clostridium sp. DL-VIII TaxID=641107 RepID=UPI0002F2C9DC|nr:hypothetical protein [Clostridium sp. DL-VIII]